jgi:hypothetical protein
LLCGSLTFPSFSLHQSKTGKVITVLCTMATSYLKTVVKTLLKRRVCAPCHRMWTMSNSIQSHNFRVLWTYTLIGTAVPQYWRPSVVLTLTVKPQVKSWDVRVFRLDRTLLFVKLLMQLCCFATDNSCELQEFCCWFTIVFEMTQFDIRIINLFFNFPNQFVSLDCHLNITFTTPSPS